ncbi:unnamed protein product [Prorocentrum cordatum]|uniref:Uncharacterized protein n=2 Tax=Prorocentrum cordatum TaxID=2364126 RepID=A0ABN9SNB0_9DINO|nr:unnamed protein product [Polarella glacialis]
MQVPGSGVLSPGRIRRPFGHRSPSDVPGGLPDMKTLVAGISTKPRLDSRELGRYVVEALTAPELLGMETPPRCVPRARSAAGGLASASARGPSAARALDRLCSEPSPAHAPAREGARAGPPRLRRERTPVGEEGRAPAPGQRGEWPGGCRPLPRAAPAGGDAEGPRCARGFSPISSGIARAPGNRTRLVV